VARTVLVDGKVAASSVQGASRAAGTEETARKASRARPKGGLDVMVTFPPADGGQGGLAAV
jgi:hypothetical protein